MMTKDICVIGLMFAAAFVIMTWIKAIDPTTFGSSWPLLLAIGYRQPRCL